MSTDDFDYILEIAREDLDKPLNPDLCFTARRTTRGSRENVSSTPPTSSSYTYTRCVEGPRAAKAFARSPTPMAFQNA
jgi:hypothetical protein